MAEEQTISGAGGIPSGEAWGSPTITVESPRHFELLKSAADLGEAGHRASAVVAAQSAVEVYVERVMTDLARRLAPVEVGEAALALVRSFTLMNKQERGLFNALVARSTERLEGDEALWRDYHAHVERRNRIVHSGYEPVEQETRDSLEVALHMVERIFELHTATLRVT
jgi:HEPN domain-containing protein